VTHTGIGNLEENVLHNVAAVWALELELVALEQDIVETPDGGREDSLKTALTPLNFENKVNGALAGVTGSPGLPRHGVGGVSVGAETLAVNPRLGDGVGSLLLAETKHLGHNCGGGDLDQNNVVQTDLVVGVLQGENTLDFMGFDHCLQDVLDCEDLTTGNISTSTVGTRDPVSDCENTAQVVGRMTPLSSEPAVVVIEPADHRTDVEGTIDRV
jgi:hypothetical protein